MTERIAERVSLFRSQIENRRLDEGTLRILESILVARDVKSLLETRSNLKEFMRSEAFCVLQEIIEKTVEQKLFVLEFFVFAFALAGDVESCLALKYEGFLLRELKSVNQDWLQVSYGEWITFAEDSLDNGFYSIAVKGCEKALLCIQRNNTVDLKPDILFQNAQVVEKIMKLKDVAVALVASHSVRALTAEYLKKKTGQPSREGSSYPMNTQCFASLMFRNGIKKRNIQKLREHQKLKLSTTES